MVNPWLVLSGIGMMTVGILVPIWWWKTRKVPVKYFGYGAILWILAITPKIILDTTISGYFNSYLQSLGTLAFVSIYGFYVGLRTGLFESGLTYLAALKTKLKKITWKQAVAFGLGFGGIEALLLGGLSFLSTYAFIIYPDVINQVPEAQREILIQQLNQSTWIVLAPIVERIAIIIIHVFATLLVFYAIKKFQKKYLLYSIGFKTIVDGIIPALQVYIGTETLLNVYLMEIPFIGLGIIAFVGILWVQQKWSEKLDEKVNYKHQ